MISFTESKNNLCQKNRLVMLYLSFGIIYHSAPVCIKTFIVLKNSRNIIFILNMINI